MAYQNIVASVEKSIYDWSIAVLFVMTVTNVLQSQLLKILNNVKDIFYFFSKQYPCLKIKYFIYIFIFV